MGRHGRTRIHTDLFMRVLSTLSHVPYPCLSVCFRVFPWRSQTSSSALRRRRRTRGGTAGIEMTPVQDGVEAEEEVSLRLPAPERAVREHHDVPLPDRRVQRDGMAGDRVAADEDAGEEQIAGIGREREQDAGRLRAAKTATAAAESATAASAAAAATALRLLGCGRETVKGRQTGRRGVGLHVHVARAAGYARPAAAAA